MTINLENPVHHPSHYGGEQNQYEAIKVIEAWLGLSGVVTFDLGNTLKYICRAGKKDVNKRIEDLEKARWYLDHAISILRNMEADDAQKAVDDNQGDVQAGPPIGRDWRDYYTPEADTDRSGGDQTAIPAVTENEVTGGRR